DLFERVFEPADSIAHGALDVRLRETERRVDALRVLFDDRREADGGAARRAVRLAVKELLLVERVVVAAAHVDARGVLEVPIEIALGESVLAQVRVERVAASHLPGD